MGSVLSRRHLFVLLALVASASLLISTTGSFSAFAQVADADNDGVPDDADECPGTLPEHADAVTDAGCHGSQLDTDNDGVSNIGDSCPETSPGQAVEEEGCTAARFVVNSTGGASDESPGDDACSTGATLEGFTARECTLRAAIEETEARPGPDTIELSAGTFDASELLIAHNLTITGAGRDWTVLDADGSGLFTIEGAPTVVFEDVTLTGGSTDEGGALYMHDGDVTFVDSAVSGNSATYGGGIYNYTGHLTLDNTDVQDNSASYSGGGVYTDYGVVVVRNDSAIDDNSLRYSDYGAGIYNDYGEVRITDSTVDSNTCDGCYGGGIYNYEGLLSVTNSSISANDGGGGEFEDAPYPYEGGGIYNDYGKVALDNVLLWGNDAYYEGGGIYSYEGSVDIRNSRIASNTTDGGYGGGIYSDYAPVTLTDTDVVDNGWVLDENFEPEATTYEGGGIYMSEAALEWSGGALSGNMATDYGGGLYNYVNAITLTDVDVDGNWAGYEGGGIYNEGNLTFVRGSITDNHADSYGGGLYSYWISKLVDTTVDGNSAGIPDTEGDEGSWGEGGGIYTDDEGLQIVRSTVSNNTSTGDGGGLYVYYDTEISNSTFVGNSAGYDGGAIYGSDDVALTNVTIVRNSANTENDGGEGGGLYNSNGYDTDLENTIIAENQSGNCTDDVRSGGHNLDDDGSCGLDAPSDLSDVADAGLMSESANLGGPTQVMALDASSVAINAAGNESCPATDQRGVARPQGDACDIGAFEFEGTPTAPSALADFTVTSEGDAGDANTSDPACATSASECTLRAAVDQANETPGPNTIALPAGTYVLHNGNLDIERSTTILGAGAETTIIEGNGDDEIFYIDQGPTATFEDVTLQNGGDNAVYIDEGDVTFRDSVVTDSWGYYGGGFYVYSGHLTLDNSDVIDNEAEYYGGGIYTEYGSVAITNGSAIDGNWVYDYGGGIYNDYGEVFISDSSVDGNTCDYCDGGGIYNYEGFVSVTSSTISDNDGGLSEFESDAPYAEDGGGLYNDYGKVVLDDVTVAGNDVHSDGGGIYNNEGEVSLESSTVSNNTTDDGYGGGIYNEDGPLTLSDSDVVDNGGASSIATDPGCEDFLPFCGDFDPCEFFGFCVDLFEAPALEAFDVTGDLTYEGGGIYNDYGALQWVGGTLSGNAASGAGGGLYNNNNAIRLTDVDVSGNSSEDIGGAIYNYGTLTFENGTLTDNDAPWGGGIYNDWVVKLTDSTLSGNSAFAGGGVFHSGDAESFKTTGSTFSGNSAVATSEDSEWGAGAGGAVFTEAPFEATNSTFASNTTNGVGGALMNLDDLTLTNVTIAANSADDQAGGLFNQPESGAQLKNTIVADNTGGDCGTEDQAVESAGHNLDSDRTCGFDAGSDRPNADPLLWPLADGEGDTATVALKAGSPAIDAGGRWVCPAFDQRGVWRARDGDVDGNARCDIGAFEFRPSSLSIDDVEVTESNAATTAATFTITRAADGDGAGSVDFSSHAGTATGDDFESVSGTRSFAANETSQSVTVNVLGDVLPELDEHFTVALANARFATITDASGRGTINDDGDVADEVVTIVPDGGTATTGQATAESPTATTITTPNGGTVTIAEAEVTEEAPSGWSFLGEQVNITAPPADSPAEPLVIEFRLDASVIPTGMTIDTLTVFRNGAEAAAECPELEVALTSDYPCVAARALETDGDFTITVRTMEASAWNFGRPGTSVGAPTTGGGGGTSRHELTVVKVGKGQGTVESSPAGISCGRTCSATFPPSVTVRLTAEPTEDSRFVEWSGPCSGSGVCVVPMTQSRLVGANFRPADQVMGELTARSTLVLDYVSRTDTLRADLSSSRQECETHRKVTFKKRRQGVDLVLARRWTYAGGVARLRGISDPHGTYYAKVKRSTTQRTGSTATLTCSSDTSNLLRVGGPR